MNNNILPSDEFIEYEGQFYTNPQKGLDEQNAFIDNLRNVQNANNAEINAQTYNLGTAVPSNLGGLVGGEGYWTSRYQTPQTNDLATDLMTANRYTALTESMQNNLAAKKQRLDNAYRAAQLRAGTSTPDSSGSTGDLNETPNDSDALTAQDIGGASRSSSQPSGSTWTSYVIDDYVFTQNQDGRIVNTDHPDYRKASDGFFYQVGQQNDIWSGDPKTRAENLSQLEKIRQYAKTGQGGRGR